MNVDQREAMFWIASYLMIANNAIRRCAPDAAKSPFQAMVDRLVEAVGLTTATAVLSRYHWAGDLAARIFAVANDAVECLPEMD